MKEALEEKVSTARAILKRADEQEDDVAFVLVEQALPLLEEVERELRAAFAPAERGKFLRVCESVLREASDAERKRMMRLIGPRITEDESKTSKCEKQKAARRLKGAERVEVAQTKLR